MFAVENGMLKEIATTQLGDDNRFAFSFEPEREAFFVVGINAANAIDGYTFYFKPGDGLNVTINEDHSYTLTNQNTPENKELAAWHAFIAPLAVKSVYFMEQNSTYVDFFPLLEEKLAAMGDCQPAYTGNQTFTEAFEALRKYDVLYYALNHLRSPRSAHPHGEDFPDYYRNISIAEVTASPQLLAYPYGMEIVSIWMLTFTAFDNTLTAEQIATMRDPRKRYEQVVETITGDIARGEMTLRTTRYFKSREGVIDFEKKFGKHLATEEQRQRMERIIQEGGEKAAPLPAADFSFSDREGKVVSLSDFKGKVVYVDVWATWCVPCRMEILPMIALEKEYHGQDIVFMSVSVDAQKDHAKWERFITANEMKGVQLFAGNDATKIKLPYGITGIPRFILVGKDGSLIEKDAPRPSSSEIRATLNAALKQ